MAFPDDRLRINVEAYVDGDWVDVRANREVLAANGITVQRGRQNESPRPAQSQADLDIKSPTGKWSPRNPRSPYFRKIGRNTRLRIALNRVVDTFDRSNLVDQWGTPTDGGGKTWSTSSPAASFDVTSNVGTIATVFQANPVTAVVGTYGDCEVLTKLRTSALNATVEFGIAFRFQDVDNYMAVFYDHANAAVSYRRCVNNQSVAGGLSGGGGDITVAANTWYWMRAQFMGSALRVKMWEDGTDEPATWWSNYDGDIFKLGALSRVGGVGIHTANVTNPATAVISCDYFEVNDWRFHGEIPSWPQRWTGGGRDVHAPISPSGIIRRLDGNGAKQLDSAMYRAITDPANADSLVAYNPGEDGSGSTQAASGIDNGAPLSVTGTSARFATSTAFPGSAPLITMGADTSLRGRISTGGDTNEFRFRMLCKFPPAATIADATPIVEIGMRDDSTRKYILRYRSTGDLQLLAYDQQWNLVGDSGSQNFNLDGLRAMIGFQVVQSGANVNWQIATHKILDDDTEVGQAANGTFNSINVGPPIWYVIAQSGGLTDAEVGHFTIVNDVTALNNLAPGALTGYAGESCAERFLRLCDENGIDALFLGSVPDTPPIGPQIVGTLMDNLIAVEQLDGGQILEPRQFFGLAFRPQHTLFNQVTTAELSYANREIFDPPPQPTDDDLLTKNDVTAERIGGSSVRSVQLDGPMSINEQDADDPGIGSYPYPLRVLSYDDGQLRDIAAWYRHLGTYDGYRWATLATKCHGLLRRSKPTLAAAVAAVDVGDMYVLTDLPEWLPPEDERVIVLGVTEHLNDFEHNVTYAGVPGWPYRVTERIDFFGNNGDRADSADSTVNTNFTVGNTSLSVAVNVMPLWKTGATDFNIMAQGVVLRVTNISGASSPQTFTVDAAPVNGITLPRGTGVIEAGESIHLYPLPVRALNGGLFQQPWFVSGADSPSSEVAIDPAVGTAASLTSTSYVATADGVALLGTSFVASSYGAAVLHIAAQLSNNGANQTLCGFSLKTGALLDQGEEILAPADARALMMLGGDAQRVGMTLLLTGLDERTTYNVVLKYKVTGGGGTVSRRSLVVKPVSRTLAGALPGELIPMMPEVKSDREDASDTSTSTSYTTADMNVCGETFEAPPSGRVLIHISAYIENSAANNTFMGFEVRAGTVVGSGTVVTGFGADDSRAISRNNINEAHFGRTFAVTGLTPGSDYNAQLMHRVTAGTGTLQYRHIVIEPTT